MRYVRSSKFEVSSEISDTSKGVGTKDQDHSESHAQRALCSCKNVQPNLVIVPCKLSFLLNLKCQHIKFNDVYDERTFLCNRAFFVDRCKSNMAGAGCLHLQYSSKDFFTISLVQVAAAWTAVAVSNYTLRGVSLISSTARSLRLFCLVFSMLCYTLLRFKSQIKFTVSFDNSVILLLFSHEDCFAKPKKKNIRFVCTHQCQST